MASWLGMALQAVAPQFPGAEGDWILQLPDSLTIIGMIRRNVSIKTLHACLRNHRGAMRSRHRSVGRSTNRSTNAATQTLPAMKIIHRIKAP